MNKNRDKKSGPPISIRRPNNEQDDGAIVNKSTTGGRTNKAIGETSPNEVQIGSPLPPNLSPRTPGKSSRSEGQDGPTTQDATTADDAAQGLMSSTERIHSAESSTVEQHQENNTPTRPGEQHGGASSSTSVPRNTSGEEKPLVTSKSSNRPNVEDVGYNKKTGGASSSPTGGARGKSAAPAVEIEGSPSKNMLSTPKSKVGNKNTSANKNALITQGAKGVGGSGGGPVVLSPGDLNPAELDANYYKTVEDYTKDFSLFETVVPKHKADLLPEDMKETQVWEFYALGGEDDKALNLDPVVFLPSEGTGPDVYFYALDALSAKGYKCIALQPPCYNVEEFVKGFGLFLDHIQARRCHLFGSGLGGYLAQVYGAHCPRRVASLMICNSYCSTPYSVIGLGAGMVIGMLPIKTLQRIVLKNHVYEDDPDYDKVIDKTNTSTEQGLTQEAYRRNLVAEAEAWVKGRMMAEKTINGTLLASRVAMAYAAAELAKNEIPNERVLILESYDLTDHKQSGEMTKLKERYPSAKVSYVKTGGAYPFLACVAETIMYIEIHLRNADYFPDFDEEPPTPVNLKGPGGQDPQGVYLDPIDPTKKLPREIRIDHANKYGVMNLRDSREVPVDADGIPRPVIFTQAKPNNRSALNSVVGGAKSGSKSRSRVGRA